MPRGRTAAAERMSKTREAARSVAGNGPLPTGSVVGFRDYVELARPSHWIKHIMMVPGFVLALLLHERGLDGLAGPVILGLLSAACIASANYVLNEWLDAPFDVFHPLKADRPAAAKPLSAGIATVEYLALAALGLVLASAVNVLYIATSTVFLASAWIYNVSPVRSKNRVYLDVITESFNSPIRLTLGWAIVDGGTLPPSSLLAAFWMSGAFLMAVKRLAEYRAAVATGTMANLSRYRRSFASYTEPSLLISSFVYSLLAAFFLAVFLVKYRIEYLLSMPFFTALFGVYLAIGLSERSAAQTPERLFRERRLILISAVLAVVLALLTWIDLPILARLAEPHYIELPFD